MFWRRIRMDYSIRMKFPSEWRKDKDHQKIMVSEDGNSSLILWDDDSRFSHFLVKNTESKPTHPLWQVETRPLALGLRAPPNLAKARLWDYLFFGCDAGTGDSWEAQFLINWPFNGCKVQLSKNARLSQDVVSGKKWIKNQKGNEKPGSNPKIPCVFNRSAFRAPCCFKNTIRSFLPFSCVPNLMETLELGEVFFPRFYVDYAVPTEEHLGSTADAVTNLVSPRSVGKRGRSSAEDQRSAPVGCIGGILPLASGIFV